MFGTKCCDYQLEYILIIWCSHNAGSECTEVCAYILMVGWTLLVASALLTCSVWVLLQKHNSIKKLFWMKSWAVSCVRCLYWTNVSRTILVIVIRGLMPHVTLGVTSDVTSDHMMTMTTMMTEMVLGTLVQYRHLTWLIAWEDFIEFSHFKSLRTWNLFYCDSPFFIKRV
jgi:hypothetical protein